ncbi:MAG: ACP S-malonyltransferase [Pseudomonadota bacterium]
MGRTALIFPGQGSQSIGMGRALADAYPAARTVFEEVDEALQEKLSALMWDGDEATLTLTANTQPALMAVSVAAYRALESETGFEASQAAFVAGHSLGEYSALAATGALSVTDAARLLRLRGEAMQAAVPPGEGAMAALLGADESQAEAACAAAGGLCEIANDNAPGQIVLSGETSAIDAACAWAKENGVKKAMPLSVSAPFHCSMMQPAADAMATALAQCEIRAPAAPLIANVTAAPTQEPNEIRSQLVAQVTGRVRWRESVLRMVEGGVDRALELGAGKVLTVMNRRTDKALVGAHFGAPQDLDGARAALGI